MLNARPYCAGRPSSAARGVLAVAAAVLALAGCASAPTDHFYSLSNGIGGGAGAAPAQVDPGYYIELPAVTAPQQLARVQMLVSSGAGQVDVKEQERWSAPPAAEIGQALSLAITGELGTIDVFRTPTPKDAPVYRISTSVQRFESAPGQYALIDAVWSVHKVGTEQVLTCRSVAEEKVGAGYDALVAGHRRAVNRVGAAISKAVRQMAGGGKGGC
ncbi:PqiC family protein [Rugamonas sp.]|uniref:PqiC family protein n=1 Tax=Rugamonas sp. TaxID=1926287 RepID=UPI0025F97037|nr:PqiC family protein [Rugamonas sp.]